MWDGGNRDKMEFEFYEAGCFLKVGVVEERWIASATGVARVLNVFRLLHDSSFLHVTHIECCRKYVMSDKNSEQLITTYQKGH
jgi:hypothetical protein